MECKNIRKEKSLFHWFYIARLIKSNTKSSSNPSGFKRSSFMKALKLDLIILSAENICVKENCKKQSESDDFLRLQLQNHSLITFSVLFCDISFIVSLFTITFNSETHFLYMDFRSMECDVLAYFFFVQ